MVVSFKTLFQRRPIPNLQRFSIRALTLGIHGAETATRPAPRDLWIHLAERSSAFKSHALIWSIRKCALFTFSPEKIRGACNRFAIEELALISFRKLQNNLRFASELLATDTELPIREVLGIEQSLKALLNHFQPKTLIEHLQKVVDALVPTVGFWEQQLVSLEQSAQVDLELYLEDIQRTDPECWSRLASIKATYEAKTIKELIHGASCHLQKLRLELTKAINFQKEIAETYELLEHISSNVQNRKANAGF
jgi:hypothetical protein